MARASAYHEAHPLPCVNQMMTAGGAGYQGGPSPFYPYFRTSVAGRIQTPLIRVGAYLKLSAGANNVPGDRGRMFCR